VFRRAARVLPQGVAVRFVVSDFNDIDQSQTTATIRADTAAATLRERREPSQVLVSSTSFTASSGTVEAINSGSTLFSVSSPSGIPTGTFNLTLASLIDVSLLTIDIAAMSSLPNITVSVSGNGLTWTPATTVALNGSRLNAWIPLVPTKYIQVVLTPTHPDNLGGSTYTFGITDLSGSSVDYNLVSDVFFNELWLQTQSTQVQLVASEDAGLTYYLTLDDGTDSPVTAVVIVISGTRSFPRRAYIFFARAGEGPEPRPSPSPACCPVCSKHRPIPPGRPGSRRVHPYIDTARVHDYGLVLLAPRNRSKRSQWSKNTVPYPDQGQKVRAEKVGRNRGKCRDPDQLLRLRYH
jgi:hypothetical protein